MKINFIALKTQETQLELPEVIEPIITQKLAQVGVEVYKSVYFSKFEHLNKSIFGLLENNTVILVDLSNKNIDSLLGQISKFYNTESTDFSQGKVWKDDEMKRCCILYDTQNTNFVKNIDKEFLRRTFAPTKYLTILKTSGLSETEIKRRLKTIPNAYGFEIFVTSDFLDCELNILADADYYSTNVLNDYIRRVYELLNEHIYSDEDSDLYQTLMDVLSVRNLKVAICDGLTNGLFFHILNEKIVNNKEKIVGFYNITKREDLKEKLKMDDEIIKKYHCGDNKIAYEIAFAALQDSKADIALTLYGTAENPCIAIGDPDTINLFTFRFSHNKSLIYNIMIQNSVHKLLKKLKKNDRLF